MAQTKAKKPTKKKKKGHGGTVLTVLMVVLILVASAFIYYLGRTIYVTYKNGEQQSSGESADPITYDTTPVAQSKKVGYYLVGLMGPEGLEDELEMLSLCCFDKKENTLNIMQIPQDTYLGEDATFKVKKSGEVFANPQDYVWCDSCRVRVYEPEIGEDNTHKKCGIALSTKEGSATVNLVEVINRQYGLPVDGYYIFEQDTLRKLVDLVGGVNIDLAFNVTVDDTTYQKGVRTVDGQAAMKYIAAAGDTVSQDIDRFTRFQQVFTAILQRLFAMDDDKLTADVFQPLMVGSTPIRVAVGDNYKQMVELTRALSKVTFENMTACVLPGEEAKLNGVTYYSVHREELLTLLNGSFNPYGDKLGEGDLNVSEIAKTKESDLAEHKLSEWVQEQSMAAATESTAAPNA